MSVRRTFLSLLVFAAAYVYRIKMESTARVERVLRLRAEIREQRDAIAVLRSEWAKLDAPLRLQGLVERHLALKPINATRRRRAARSRRSAPRCRVPSMPQPMRRRRRGRYRSRRTGNERREAFGALAAAAGPQSALRARR